jgi:hypothetical protein
MGVVGGPVAEQLGVDPGAAGAGVLQLLQHQHRRALAHDEPVAARVERARGALRVVVAGGHGADDGEGAEAERRQRGLHPAGDRHVGLPSRISRQPSPMAMAPEAQLIALVEFGPGEAELDGHVARGGAAEDREGQQRVHRADALPEEVAELISP